MSCRKCLQDLERAASSGRFSICYLYVLCNVNPRINSEYIWWVEMKASRWTVQCSLSHEYEKQYIVLNLHRVFWYSWSRPAQGWWRWFGLIFNPDMCLMNEAHRREGKSSPLTSPQPEEIFPHTSKMVVQINVTVLPQILYLLNNVLLSRTEAARSADSPLKRAQAFHLPRTI